MVAIGTEDCSHLARETTIIFRVSTIRWKAGADAFAMISHKYRLIFVHIPRTAGTSIEQWILGQDQWCANPSEKHLTAIEAKDIYSEYWSHYWKFSMLRNPLERFISMLRFKDHFGVSINAKGELDISGYIKRFSAKQGVVLEHDHRFSSVGKLNRLSMRSDYRPYRKGAIYSNMIGNEMDMVFNYEKLEQAVQFLSQRFSLSPEEFPHIEASVPKTQPSPFVSNETRRLIQELHSLDIELFPDIDNS